MCTEATLNYITDSIKETAINLFSNNLKSVILYGSYARGDYDNESDIDIFILVDIPTEKLSEHQSHLSKIASRLSMDSEDCVTVSISLQDFNTYDKYKAFLPYYKNINTEGVVIYAS